MLSFVDFFKFNKKPIMSDKQPKSIKTFSNNTKKFLLNAIALFIVVTFTFYVESVGDEYENRQKYLDNSKKILS